MNQPSLYSRANDVQRHDAEEIANEYVNILEEHSDGKQSLLDVGCGSGDVLMEIVVPILARGFIRITGIDISSEMLEYSRKRYANLEGVDFKQLNIETDQLPLKFHEQYDRVTSFYCLHWIQNQRKSLENIFKSLRKNGDCLLVFLGSNTAIDAYRALSKDPQWKEYVKDLDRIPCPFQDQHVIEKEYESLLEQAGFIDRKVEVKKKRFTYEGLTNFKENMKAINVFHFPPSKYEEYFDALCDRCKAMGFGEKIPGTENYRFFLDYRLVVAYARKGK